MFFYRHTTSSACLKFLPASSSFFFIFLSYLFLFSVFYSMIQWSLTAKSRICYCFLIYFGSLPFVNTHLLCATFFLASFLTGFNVLTFFFFLALFLICPCRDLGPSVKLMEELMRECKETQETLLFLACLMLCNTLFFLWGISQIEFGCTWHNSHFKVFYKKQI